MGIERAFNSFHRWLDTWPSAALTIILIVAALVLVSIAIHGTSSEKAIATAYVVFP